MPWLRQLFLGLSPQEAAFGRRGFAAGKAHRRDRLERVGRTFIAGYNAAIDTARTERLMFLLQEIEPELRGFAFEGAAMGLCLLDHLTPWRRGQWRSFLEGPGAPHIYMVHVGAGWAVARLPWLRRNIERALEGFDPLLRWLVVDGYGFHEGYFHWPRSIQDQRIPAGLSGYASRAFNQGLGRSLWFVAGADIDRIGAVIGRFSAGRRADLWAGIGLAAAYAGGIERTGLEKLRDVSGPHLPHLAQGAAFAAAARARAGNPAAHTSAACEILCGTSAERAAEVTNDALMNLHDDLRDEGDRPAYEVWRQRIRSQFSERSQQSPPGLDSRYATASVAQEQP